MLVVRLTDGRTDCRNFLEERGGRARNRESRFKCNLAFSLSLVFHLFSFLPHSTFACTLYERNFAYAFLTFLPHAHLEALFEPAVLALVPVVLVHGTAAAAPALVGQVASD